MSGRIQALVSSAVAFMHSMAGATRRTAQDKMSETVSVYDGGAIGNGVADDRTAINYALTTLGAAGASFELYFPPGSYLIGSNLTVPSGACLRFAAGAHLIIPNGVTLTLSDPELCVGRQQIFQCTGTGNVAGNVRNFMIFPEWWGFVADGLHSPVSGDYSARAAAAARNGAAFQAALTFAGNQYAVTGNSCTVSVACGQAVFAPTLEIPSSVNVIGQAGVGSDLRYYAATGNAMELVNTNNSLVADIAISPIAGPTWNYTTGIGLRVDNVSTPIVRNVWSSGFGGGCFFLKDTIEGRFYGLVTDNANGNAYTIRGVGQGSVLNSCLATNTDIGIDFDIQSGYDWRLTDCTSKNQRATATNAFYMNGVENINLTGCGTHDSKREGIVTTSSVLNCTINGLFVNGASKSSSGTYAAMNISGTNVKLIAPKVTQNAPTYSYALILGGGATDCTYVEENFVAGTAGIILDAQPIGANTSKIHKVTTTDATPKAIWTKNVNNNAGAIIKATVIGKQREAAGAGATVYVELYAMVKTNGTASAFVIAPVKTVNNASVAGLTADLVLTSAAANAGVVSLQVTGLVSAYAVDWEATVSVISVTG